MEKQNAAIDEYQRVVGVNALDYWGWGGDLRQTYNIHRLMLYALLYFQTAASIWPYDAHIWVAIGKFYQRLERCKLAELY